MSLLKIRLASVVRLQTCRYARNFKRIVHFLYLPLVIGLVCCSLVSLFRLQWSRQQQGKLFKWNKKYSSSLRYDIFLLNQKALNQKKDIISNPISPKAQVISKPYGFRELEMTAHHLEQFRARLLVFNGTNFVVYNLEPRNQSGWHPWHQCNQCQKIIPLLAHALTEIYPKRFQKGQPVFQLFFTDADYFSSKCVNPGLCNTISDFAPVLLFGSAPKNSSELPTVKGFPHVYYTNCLYDFKVCQS
jgi:hypothetical protein